MPKKAPCDSRILVVDDEPQFRAVLKLTFESMGYRVSTASNGTEAFALLKAQAFDVVVSDIRMPGGDGVELLDRVRAELTEMPPVVLLISGFAELSTEDAYNKGAEALFGKPFNRTIFFETLDRLMTPPGERWQQESDEVDVNLSVHLEVDGMARAIDSKVMSLARGGMFIQLPQSQLPNVNDAASFKISGSEKAFSLEGRGIIRWVRLQQTPDYPSGCGLEFTFLNEADRKMILDYINAVKPKAYIPNR
jgi:CheY-like chemotaxis protein